MSSSTLFSVKYGTPFVHATFYRQVVGKLQYLLFTIPDIIFVFSKLSQFINVPIQTHRSMLNSLCAMSYIQRITGNR